MVHKYPHEVTIYAGGPLTNLALAIALDPEFPKLAQELVFMGPIINPGSADPEFYQAPRRGFNCWWDPEATRMVFRSPWPKITVTTIDISIKTNLTKANARDWRNRDSTAAQYVAKYSHGGYMWDELAAEAWLDPSIITKEQLLYMDISLDRGASYGDTLVWPEGSQPGLGEQKVHIIDEVDNAETEQHVYGFDDAPDAETAFSRSDRCESAGDARCGARLSRHRSARNRSERPAVIRIVGRDFYRFLVGSKARGRSLRCW